MPVRRLSPEDLPAILEVQRACYPEALREAEAVFAAKLRAFPGGCRGLHRGDLVGAYVFFQPWRRGRVLPLGDAAPPPADPDCLYVHDLAVIPAWRGTGAAGDLLAAVLGLAADLGLGTLALTAVQGAEPFWERQGFRRVRSFTYAPGVDATYMVRILERNRPAASRKGGAHS
ncbi:GNAT family N-acetyltransferase [Mesoterricola silvestris]|uniref:N-acetyltransferase n=1 Tax=Mesoterricola silvestris TaxID=2927979 RepID=A0AA48H0F2_9BACT|nr:GNAT family N-acetyltransferase [Mesoterricola silvestris]BDU73738.1 N-acetyltransferase [Mesoterricola silvestris]